MEAIITIVGFLGAGKTTLLKYLIEKVASKAINISSDVYNKSKNVKHTLQFCRFAQNLDISQEKKDIATNNYRIIGGNPKSKKASFFTNLDAKKVIFMFLAFLIIMAVGSTPAEVSSSSERWVRHSLPSRRFCQNS